MRAAAAFLTSPTSSLGAGSRDVEGTRFESLNQLPKRGEAPLRGTAAREAACSAATLGLSATLTSGGGGMAGFSVRTLLRSRPTAPAPLLLLLLLLLFWGGAGGPHRGS
jgi:hypothetical protein